MRAQISNFVAENKNTKKLLKVQSDSKEEYLNKGFTQRIQYNTKGI